MNAAVLQEKEMKIGAGMASKQEWVQCDEHFAMKVLSVDEANHNVEALIKVKGPYRSGKHTHTCETHAFVLEGEIKNHTAGCTFGPGDYCYQGLNDEHDEEFPEGDTVVYASYRGHQDTLVEFYGEDGEVCGLYTVSDYMAGMI